MKMFTRICAFALVLCMVGAMFAGCSNPAKPFQRVWYCYMLSDGSTELYLSDFDSIAKLELTAEFTADGKYVLHYYVNGEEGTQYPQSGKYEMDGDKIFLIEANCYGEIVNGELIMTFSGSSAKQYYRTNP